MECVGVPAGECEGDGGPRPQLAALNSMTASRRERVTEATGAVMATSLTLHITWSISLLLLESKALPVNCNDKNYCTPIYH